MKKIILSVAVFALVLTSCSSDDNNNNGCQTCAAFEIEVNGVSQTSPAIEVCEGENGNAVVTNVDTGQPFAAYIASIELITPCE